MIIRRIQAIDRLFLLLPVLAFVSCEDSASGSGSEGPEKEEEEISRDYTSVPLLVGARGKFRPQDPENTVQSLHHARAWVGGVYINVRLTSDGVPVLMHDAAVDRTTDGSGAVSSMTLEEIRALDAGGGDRVPTLEEYLQVILSREEAGMLQPFSRIFMNPNDSSPAAIGAMYAVAMDPRFASLAGRYTWQFGNLLNNDAGAAYLRTLDDTTAIGTFLPDAGSVDDMIQAVEAVDGETILVWPGEYNSHPEVLQAVADHDLEGGISRVSSNNLHVIPKAHDDPNVKVLFTWHTDELSWWYPDE